MAQAHLRWKQPECSAGSCVRRRRQSCRERSSPTGVGGPPVGRDALSVAQVPRVRGVGWHTIMTAVLELGEQLLAYDHRPRPCDRARARRAQLPAWQLPHPTSWVTSFVALDADRLLDVVQHRNRHGRTTLDHRPTGRVATTSGLRQSIHTRGTPPPCTASCPTHRSWSITSTSSGSATAWSTRSAAASSKRRLGVAAAGAIRSQRPQAAARRP